MRKLVVFGQVLTDYNKKNIWWLRNTFTCSAGSRISRGEGTNSKGEGECANLLFGQIFLRTLWTWRKFSREGGTGSKFVHVDPLSNYELQIRQKHIQDVALLVHTYSYTLEPHLKVWVIRLFTHFPASSELGVRTIQTAGCFDSLNI